ncbi:MAG: family 16 glycosylhydrolase [Bacteroidota bacterium]|nr:family 16 glycosylhydrolase [Bacteroidota bacterium]
MSFKLFLASTFGLIKSTSKIEAAHQALLADYLLFCKFEKSSELNEYHELELLVNSATFKQKKSELRQLSLKGSKEEAQLKELKKLERNSRLKKYYAIEKSEELKRFEEISGSEELVHYKELKAAVEMHSYAAIKKKGKGSQEYAAYVEFQTVKKSVDIQFFKRFRKSTALLNYELMKDSPERKRLEELQKITASVDFKARVIYLEDKQKWEKTDEAAKEKRLAELRQLPQLVNYLKYKNSSAFDFFRKWALVFEDCFESGKLDPQKWMTQSHGASQALGKNFSQAGDLQAFTEGKNVLADGKSLKIEVRKEKAKGMQWQIPFGFVESEFDYTSGIVSTAGAEWWKHGILEAKVKYDPARNLVDAIYLLGEASSPQVNLLEMGVKNRLGFLSKADHGIHAESESISGLKKGEFYIFRLEWTAHSMVWKINEREIFALNHNIPAFKMHLNAASIVVAEPTGSLPHRFEIDWVRFYQPSKA